MCFGSLRECHSWRSGIVPHRPLHVREVTSNLDGYMFMMLVCTKCQKLQPEEYYRETAKPYRRHTCRNCESDERMSRDNHNPDAARARARRYQMNKSEMRRMGLHVERWIVEDSRRTDRKLGRLNDLTTAWVAEQIASGCSYCGETQLHMTMDRIDNTLGHIQSNVVPACERCNYIRRDMPYAAWLKLVPTLVEIREAGLFGVWTGGIREAVRRAHANGVAFGRPAEEGPSGVRVRELRKAGKSWSDIAAHCECTVAMARRRYAGID